MEQFVSYLSVHFQCERNANSYSSWGLVRGGVSSWQCSWSPAIFGVGNE